MDLFPIHKSWTENHSRMVISLHRPSMGHKLSPKCRRIIIKMYINGPILIQNIFCHWPLIHAKTCAYFKWNIEILPYKPPYIPLMSIYKCYLPYWQYILSTKAREYYLKMGMAKRFFLPMCNLLLDHKHIWAERLLQKMGSHWSLGDPYRVEVQWGRNIYLDKSHTIIIAKSSINHNHTWSRITPFIWC